MRNPLDSCVVRSVPAPQMAEDRINRLIAGAQGKLDRFQHVNEEQVSGRRQHQEKLCQTKMSSNVITNPDNTKSLVST